MSLINNMLNGLNKEPVKVKVLEDDPSFISVKNLKYHIHNQLGLLLFLLALFVVIALGFIRNGFIENNAEHLIIGFKKNSHESIQFVPVSQSLPMVGIQSSEGSLNEAVAEVKGQQAIHAEQFVADNVLNTQSPSSAESVNAPKAQNHPQFDLSYNALEMKEADRIASISEQGQDELSRLLALSYVHMNRTDDAIKILVKTLPDIKTDQEHYILLAALYQKSMLHQKALEIYWKLVETYPSDGKSWAGLAISLEAIGEKKEALAGYKRAKLSRNLNGPLSVYVNERIRALK